MKLLKFIDQLGLDIDKVTVYDLDTINRMIKAKASFESDKGFLIEAINNRK